MTTGLLLVDKVEGPTSHDVVGRVRRLAGTRRVGHAGTLDPMATGLLVLGVGRGTKLLAYAVGLDKTYRATIRLGAATVTDDRTGATTASPGIDPALGDDVLAAAVATLTGPISQVPSAVSAVKVAGRRSYDLVRAGEEVALRARDVTVHRFEVLSRTAGRVPDGPDGPGWDHLDLDVEVDCTSGTYVRALARDLGTALGSAGHLTSLRRTRVGGFDVADAAVLADDLDVSAHLVPLGTAAGLLMPTRTLTAAEAAELSFGRHVAAGAPPAGAGPATGTTPDAPGPVAGLDASGALVAVLRDRGAVARPELVVPAQERV